MPFCVCKCRYCDFLSFACPNDSILNEYTRALIQEIRLRSEPYHFKQVDTVYIGGGTPSLLSPSDIGNLMTAVDEYFNLSTDPEITIEANPGSLTEEKLDAYLNNGINRLSIGVQSFDNNILNILGRAHNKNDAIDAVRTAKKAGFDNINLDLMFGIPAQTMKSWKDSVQACIFTKPEHVSLYSLEVAEGTPMYKMIYEDKILELLPEQTDREMYHEALRMLNDAGYRQYEISNCALPGHESRHNLKYWSYDEYLGLGPGASSFIGGDRLRNYSKMSEYLKAVKEYRPPVDEEQSFTYSKREEMGIFTFTALRTNAGLNFRRFKEVFGTDFYRVYPREKVLKYKGLLVEESDGIHLTERGMDTSNVIMAEFV